MIALNIEAIRVSDTLYRFECLYCGANAKYNNTDKLTSEQFVRRFGLKLLVKDVKS